MSLSASLRRKLPRSLRRVLRTHWVKRFGTFREREKLGLLTRESYAYGLLKAADVARYFGRNATTVCEFGVAYGSGLFSMIELAEALSAETGIRFRIVGFDTGAGLPAPAGYRTIRKSGREATTRCGPPR